MSDFGWQVFNDDGTVKYDNTVIMSRWLGSIDVPPTATTFDRTYSGINFNGGTGFAYFVPYGYTAPSGYSAVRIFPAINVNSSAGTIRIAITGDMTDYANDDSSVPAYFGGGTVHYGVYNG